MARRVSIELLEQRAMGGSIELPITISIVGIGGSGGNTVTRFCGTELNRIYKNIEVAALNTDKLALDQTVADKKVLIGQETCRGQGAGERASVGKLAMEESLDEILPLLKGRNLLILTCGLGKGTGTLGLPTLANALRSESPESLIVSLVTLPFLSEGLVQMKNAQLGLREIRELSDVVIVNSNDVLLQLCPKTPMPVAFDIEDRVLSDMIEGIIEMICLPGDINVDFQDFRTICKAENGVGSFAHIGIGVSDTSLKKALENAFNNKLLDYDYRSVRSMLLDVVCLSYEGIDIIDKRIDRIHRKNKTLGNVIKGIRFVDMPPNRVMAVSVGVSSAMLTELLGTPILVR